MVSIGREDLVTREEEIEDREIADVESRVSTCCENQIFVLKQLV